MRNVFWFNYQFQLNKLVFLFFLLTLNLSCQTTSKLQEFDNLFLGQEKSDVLETVGNPTWVERIKDQDRWTYVIYEDQLKQEKVVYFLDGFMTYKGSPLSPLISAEEQDDINQQKNIQLQLLEKTQYISNNKASSQNQSTSTPSRYPYTNVKGAF